MQRLQRTASEVHIKLPFTNNEILDILQAYSAK